MAKIPQPTEAKTAPPTKKPSEAKPKKKANGTALAAPATTKPIAPTRIYRSLAQDLPLRPRPLGTDLAAMFQNFVRDHQKEPVRQLSQQVKQSLANEIFVINIQLQAFEEAVMTGDISTVRAALRGGPGTLDLNKRDMEGRTLLHRVGLGRMSADSNAI